MINVCVSPCYNNVFNENIVKFKIKSREDVKKEKCKKWKPFACFLLLSTLKKQEHCYSKVCSEC